ASKIKDEGLGAVPDSFWDSCVDALWSTQDEAEPIAPLIHKDEKLIGPEVTEPVPGNFLFDKFRGLSRSPKIFGYLSDADGKCLQATCLHITFWAETQLRLVSFVESDLEQAMQYRLWGPYHGYPL
ncbi:unnamed protein product, partial [Cladocopium goreaui]